MKAKEIRRNTEHWRENLQSEVRSSQVKESLAFLILSGAIPEAIFNEDYQVRAVALDRLTNAQESLRQHPELHYLIEKVKDFSL